MSHNTHIGTFVPLDAIEDDIAPTEQALLELLVKLDRDDTLLHCAVVSAIVTGPGVSSRLQRQQRICSKICTPSDGAKLNAYIKAHGGPARVAVFMRGQMLELIRWASKHCPTLSESGNTFSTFETCHNFMRAALIASELWSKRVYGDRLTGEDEPGAARDRALGAFRKGMEESGGAMHMGVAFGRAKLLFCEYMPKRYPQFRAAFESATGLTIEEYLVCLGVLIPYASSEPTQNHVFRTEYVAGETAYREKFDKFLQLHSMTPECAAVELWDNFSEFGFKALREKPVLTASLGRSVVLDAVYLMECMTIGPLFRVVAKAKSSETNRIFGAFGEAFEDYTHDILKRIYPSSPFLTKRLHLGEKSPPGLSPQFEVDVALSGASELVVMEAKAVFIREAEILSDDPSRFIAELRSKYAVPHNAKVRVKGVAQLARSIGAILREEWSGFGIDAINLRNIYPVLLVHDDRLASPGANAFFNTEFRKLLGAPDGKYRVAPLVVITVRDIENIESSHEISLIELLIDFTRDQPDGALSLHDYMAMSPVFSLKIRPSATLMAESLALVDLMRAELFPKPVADAGST